MKPKYLQDAQLAYWEAGLSLMDAIEKAYPVGSTIDTHKGEMIVTGFSCDEYLKHLPRIIRGFTSEPSYNHHRISLSDIDP